MDGRRLEKGQHKAVGRLTEGWQKIGKWLAENWQNAGGRLKQACTRLADSINPMRRLEKRQVESWRKVRSPSTL
jgi:hypothetical protein